jgi:hypothetical protein
MMRRLLGGFVITVVVLSANVAIAGADSAVSAKWVVQPTPNHAEATLSDFSGVSCSSAASCAAVGSYHGAPWSPEYTFADVWSAGTWAKHRTNHPAGAGGSGLNAVSCASASNCTSVGSYAIAEDETYLGFAEVWNGSKWDVQTIAKPAGATDTELLGVSCPTASECTAVGSSTNQAGTGLALAEQRRGGDWSAQTVPEPAGAKFSQLYAVSCSSPGACTAVGYYTGAAGTARTFAVRWNGSTWGTQKTPIPSGATHSELLAVSCASVVACTAVGAYDNRAGAEVTLSETWNGSAWSIATTPNPPGIHSGQLSGVSCPIATACVAVGYYQSTNSSSPAAFAEKWQGGRWSLQTVASPAGATANVLSGVSCTTATACSAVGYYQNSGGEFTLAERYS